MSKLIQKAGFLNPNRAGRYMNYIATRDGVELLDENADSIYMRYIDTRPRAERHGEHGLFGAEDAVDLEKTLGELKAHEGNVWTIIYSLRREDAARLGYDNAASWRALLRSKQADFAEAMQILPSQLRWYAAFHDEGDHPHIHMMLWSDDPKYGFLRKDKLLHLQSVLTNMIYADELKAVYVQKDIAYKDVTGAARETMRRIVDRLESVKNAIIQEAERLRQQMEQARTASEQKSSQDEEPSAEKTSTDASTNPTLANENTSSTASHSVGLPSEYLLNSTIRLFHQMGQIFRDNAAPPSNPMGIRIDSKRRKKLMQKRLAMGHKQDDHEQEQGYGQVIR